MDDNELVDATDKAMAAYRAGEGFIPPLLAKEIEEACAKKWAVRGLLHRLRKK